MDSVSDDQDAVLEAFIRKHPLPTAKHIAEWMQTHPRHADAIKRFALDVIATTIIGGGVMGSVPDKAELDRARARALEISARSEEHEITGETLSDIAKDADTDIPRLATTLGIAREVLALLDAGAVFLPAGRMFAKTLAKALDCDVTVVDRAFANALRRPKLGHAKADGEPGLIRRTWEETIASSSMSDDRKRHWLEQD